MQRRLVFLLLSLISVVSLAQPFNPLVKIDYSPAEGTEVYTFSDDGGVTLLFKEETSAKVFILDQAMNVKRSFDVFDLPDGEDLDHLGFSNHPSFLQICYQTPDATEFQVISIRKEDGSSLRYNRTASRTRTRNVFWGTFSYKGILHVLRMPPGSQTIRLCKFEQEGNFTTQEYPVTKSDFMEKVQYKLSKIDPADTTRISNTYQTGKLYHAEDIVYMTLEEPDSTHVIAINLETGNKFEAALKSPGFALSEDKVTVYKTNSLLHGDYLYQAAASPDSLKIFIRELATGQRVAHYQMSKTGALPFSESNLVQIDEQGKRKELSQVADFFSELAQAPYLALAVNLVSDTVLQMQIGSVKPSRNRGLTGVILSEASRSTFINCLLNKYDFLPVRDDLPQLASQQNQQRRIRPPYLPFATAFTQGEHKIIGYFDYRRQQYVLAKAD